MKQSTKNIIINISCIVTAIIVTCVFFEFFFRYKEYRKKQAIKSFEYLPGIPSKDNKGFREKINLFEKGDNSTRILVLGDSYSWGDKIKDPKDIWPNILQKILAKEYPKRKIEVVNLACCGFTTVNEMEVFYKVGLRMQPDIVVVQFTLNDPLPSGPGLKRVGSDWLSEQNAVTSVPEQKRDVKKKGFSETFRKKSAFYRWLSTRFGYLEMKQQNRSFYDPLYKEDFQGWQACKKSLQLISDGAKKINAKTILMIAPYFLPGKWTNETYPLKHLNAKVIDAGENANMMVLDLFQSFVDKGRDFGSYKALYGQDGHPNETAHKIMAQTLDQFIRKNNLIR
ncbi:MAG: SGNH/GDSL hydrolase family protein [Candidatus Omnitrophica bacterium]|nr:SGNH/GDSL hydrolase family protein [Candidatus Omnitrophota bacterium]